MNIPSYFIPYGVRKPRLKRQTSVSLDKSETNTDTTKQKIVHTLKEPDKRRGEDRRKRNVKVLLDTRRGGDRRHNRRKLPKDLTA